MTLVLKFPRLFARVVISIAMLCLAPLAMPGGVVTKANAQVQASVEFRSALKPYGQWRHSRHWGDVWIPAHRDRHWRPYTVGHWVYTDDYGWYWITDDREADWGWVAYHYGRWVLDGDLGWVWIPGNEWAPAWVTWRRGHDHIGWAPLPPDRIVVEYRERPDVWVFVRARDFTAPAIVHVALPLREQRVYVRQTVVVNRTVVVHDRGPRFAVNPGIAPTVVAAISGRPLHAYQVRPHVLAGTARLPNAVEVRAQDLQSKDRTKVRVTAQETRTTIKPEKDVPQPKPLAAKENGRLGEHPPKAAQAAAQQRNGKQQPEAAQEQKNGEGPKSNTAEQKKGAEPKSRAAEQKQGEASKSRAAEQKKGDESTPKAAEKKGEESKSSAAEQKKNEESKARAARQKAEESKAKAAEQKKNAESKANAARQKAEESKAKAAGQKKNAESRANAPKAAEQKHNAAPKPKAAEQHAPPKNPSAQRSQNAPARAAPTAQQHKPAGPQTEGRGGPPAKRPQPQQQDEKGKPEH